LAVRFAGEILEVESKDKKSKPMSDCLMINNSGCVIEMVAWPDYTHNAMNPYCGTGFGGSVVQPTSEIPTGAQQVIAHISDTGEADGWRVCWLGGWGKGKVLYTVMMERQAGSISDSRSL
jgi:hypothetical protein